MSAADVAFARALQHWQAESLQEAHAACLEAIGYEEGHIGAAVLASEILLRAGEPEPAAALLRDVVRRTPGEDAARVLLALIASRSAAAGRRDEARGLIARGRELMQQDPELAHMAAAAEGRAPDGSTLVCLRLVVS